MWQFLTMTDETVILDGGLATEISKMGFNIDSDPLWSARVLLTAPDVIKNVHKTFLEAGSDVIITASYQTSIPTLMDFGGVSREAAEDHIKSSVTIARRACEEFWQNHRKELKQLDNKCNEGCPTKESIAVKGERRYPLVAGSVGPFGACQHDGSEYSGEYVDDMTKEELMNWHRPRLGALVQAGADLIAIETIPALKEALAVADVLNEYPSTKAWITFTCKNGEALSHGEKFTDAITAVSSYEQVFGIGVNCINPEYVEPLLLSLKENAIGEDKVKIVYPNSGEKWSNGSWIEGSASKTFSEYADSWVNAGASWIGGCCRTSPDDIRLLRDLLLKKATQKETILET